MGNSQEMSKLEGAGVPVKWFRRRGGHEGGGGGGGGGEGGRGQVIARQSTTWQVRRRRQLKARVQRGSTAARSNLVRRHKAQQTTTGLHHNPSQTSHCSERVLFFPADSSFSMWATR